MASPSQESQEKYAVGKCGKVKVTILASEWGSSKGVLSTINRKMAIELAKSSDVEISFFVPRCSEEDKTEALRHNISIVEAEPLIAYEELEWLSFLPDDLQIDVVVGHGVKLGRQAQVIRRRFHHDQCKWVHVVHMDSEEMGMLKCSISRGEEEHSDEVELCEKADFVVGVGPKLTETFRSYLRFCKNDRSIFELTPGIFEEFLSVQKVTEEGNRRRVLVFDHGDPENFKLKGFDIVGKAIASLADTFLVFVGAPNGKHEGVTEFFLQCDLPAHRLKVRCYEKSRKTLNKLFCEVDLVLMPSRTDGFGLTGLEALSAGLPVLVSKNSGFGEALCKVPLCSSFVIDSDNPVVWAAAIKNIIWDKDRQFRLKEAEYVRIAYDKKYSWTKQSDALRSKIIKLARACLQLQIDDVPITKASAQKGTGTDVHSGEPQEAIQEGRGTTIAKKQPVVVNTGLVTENCGKESTQCWTQVIEVADPSNLEERNTYMRYLERAGRVFPVRIESGSLIIAVEVGSKKILEELLQDYQEGHLNQMAREFLVTKELLEEFGLIEFKLTPFIAEGECKTCQHYFSGSMSYLVGILVDVSGSMRNSVGYEKVKVDGGPWARSVFKAIDELIKHDVPSSNQTFALAFGSRFLSREVFDLLGTLAHANEETLFIEALKSRKIPLSQIINEILDILEKEGAPRVRTWARMNLLLSVFDDTTAAVMLYFLQGNPEFTRRFVYQILPIECREIVMGVRSLVKEGVNRFAGLLSRVGLVRPDIQESATEASVKEVIEKGKQLLVEFKMVAVNKAAIKSVQKAFEILHDIVGHQEATDERVNELMETVEPYIYGGSPLFRAIKHSVELFSHSEFANHKKILFILSDGEPSDGEYKRHSHLKELSRLGVKIASCFITREEISNPRRLYSSRSVTWKEPAKFMFGISSIIKTQEIPRALFVKRGWQIDISNNETRLFFQVNHPDVIKDVCDIAKRAVLSQDALSEILSEVDLELYINKSNKRFKPTPSDKGTCYAHAAAAVMHLAMKRIIGRVGGYPDFDELREKLITKYGEEEASTFQVLTEVCPEYRLQCKRVDAVKAIKAISEKRPVVATFFLTGAQWDQFEKFYEENGKGILTKSYLDSKTDSTSDPGGHAVVLTSYDAESLRLMNSCGEDFADGGFFRVQDADVLGLKFVDVYWDLNDLMEEEKKAYEKHGAEVARNLIESLIGLQEATYKCPKCHAESKVVEYSAHALNAMCPKCRRTFNPNREGGDLALNLYLTSLMC